MRTALPQIVAHRGASYNAPENTLTAFRLAFEQGADAIEGDFNLTRDSQIVCHHDATTQRMTGVDWTIADKTLAELQSLKVQDYRGLSRTTNHEPRITTAAIPTLAKVLATVPSGKHAVLEIKTGPEIVPAFQHAIEHGLVPLNHLRIISFHADVIRAAKQLMPTIDACWLIEFNDRDLLPLSVDAILQTLDEIHANGLSVEARPDRVTPHFVEAIRAAGRSLHTWTIDDPDLAKIFIRLGVDSITTNRPRSLREALNI